MSFIVNTPTLSVKVPNRYLTQDSTDDNLTLGYLTAVKSVDGNCLMFTVMLECGAMYSNLPIEAIYCDRYGKINPESSFNTQQLQPYSCLDGNINIVEYSVARHSEMVVKIAGLEIAARYLFTIDYNGTDLADDPEQRKTHNIVCLISGQLAALPNNKCLFTNKSLTRVDSWPKLRRIGLEPTIYLTKSNIEDLDDNGSAPDLITCYTFSDAISRIMHFNIELALKEFKVVK